MIEPRADQALAVVAVLLTKHFVFDFVLQTRYQLANKHAYGHPGGLQHAALHLAGTLPAFFLAPPSFRLGAVILAAEFVVHYHVDWIKEQLLRRSRWSHGDPRFWAVFGADQLIHGLGYIAIAWILTSIRW